MSLIGILHTISGHYFVFLSKTGLSYTNLTNAAQERENTVIFLSAIKVPHVTTIFFP